jgi:phenylpyruvate tautomerase PptA (4-oxalocrotonate tautomerase family)
MPYVALTTSANLTEAHCTALNEAFVNAIATHAGKPPGSIMASFSVSVPTMFRGSSIVHSAFVEIKYAGEFSHDTKQNIVEEFCNALDRHASVTSDRVYIKFTGTPGDQWGCDGQMLG